MTTNSIPQSDNNPTSKENPTMGNTIFEVEYSDMATNIFERSATECGPINGNTTFATLNEAQIAVTAYLSQTIGGCIFALYDALENTSFPEPEVLFGAARLGGTDENLDEDKKLLREVRREMLIEGYCAFLNSHIVVQAEQEECLCDECRAKEQAEAKRGYERGEQAMQEAIAMGQLKA